MRIAIIEDKKSDRDILVSHLAKYAEENSHVKFEITEFTDGADFLQHYKPVYDIIFLDIEMPHSNGMEVAKKIRQRDRDVIIMFITNMAGYAIKGYEVDALDFILKPAKYLRFTTKLEKAIKATSKRMSRVFTFSSNGLQYRISPDVIYYLEVIRHCIVIHTSDGNYEVWHRTMTEMEEKLKIYGFARCNVSYLVNLRYVNIVSGDTVTIGNEKLAISRGKKKEFLTALSEYLG